MQNENEKNNSGIGFSDIIRVIKKNWILICLITATIFAIGAVYTFAVKKPIYRASATVKVEIPLSDSQQESTANIGNSLTASMRYVKSVSEKAQSYTVINTVCENNDVSYSKLASELSTSYSSDSIFVTITVKDHDGELAKKLATAVAEEVSKYSTDSTDAAIADNQKFLCTISVSDAANRAYYDSPNKTLYLIISAAIGLVAGLVVVFLMEFASTKFKNPDEVTSLGLPILNTLPDDKSKEKEEDSLINPTIKNFEPYNRLIANIKYSNVDNPYKVISFTSSIMDELKTTVASNFAFTLAHNEKTVVVVDLDTRKPRVHKMFKVAKEKGIVEYLDGSIKFDELIKKTENGVDVITVGKNVVNPVTLLESEKLKTLINDLKEKYDYVVIDTPPLMACNDSAIIAGFVDGVIFNVAINQGKKKEIRASINQLKDANANIIGINITKASIKDRGGYYYYYYENYGDAK